MPAGPAESTPPRPTLRATQGKKFLQRNRNTSDTADLSARLTSKPGLFRDRFREASMRYDRSVQDGNVISLPGRPDARMASQPAEREPALRHPQALHALAKALDALLVAQFELCGLDPHPT